jgi:hypothetical protein
LSGLRSPKTVHWGERGGGHDGETHRSRAGAAAAGQAAGTGDCPRG